MAYIQHHIINIEIYSATHSEPFRKWFVLPTEDTSNIHLCAYNFNSALSPYQ